MIVMPLPVPDAASAEVGSRLKIVINVRSNDNRRFLIDLIEFSFPMKRNKTEQTLPICSVLIVVDDLLVCEGIYP